MAAKRAGGTKAGRVNKSEMIREALRALGADAAPKVVIARLKEKNVQVSPAQVSNIKAILKKKSRGRGGRPGGNRVSLEELLEAKKLVDRLGGVDAAMRALDTLSRLR